MVRGIFILFLSAIFSDFSAVKAFALDAASSAVYQQAVMSQKQAALGAGSGTSEFGSSRSRIGYDTEIRTEEGSVVLAGGAGGDDSGGGSLSKASEATGDLNKDAKSNDSITPIEESPVVGEGDGKGDGDGGGFMKKIPTWAIYGGAAVLGGLQGFFTGGPLGALAGAAMGVAGAYFYKKGDYGTAFGMMGGAIVGTALGGPIGGIIGAVVGGLLGHFLGELF
jgi:hypothetical protein